ncbi:hypothetical protein QM012_006311 [Aureobasidium pullulans]|uniref:Uncharacterized protein n=1 Tax=Aureobasidium pullulans TaxID=5580 RepID=A0ABR0TS87_AURPU
MVNPFSFIQRGLNILLPFATPGTPLYQDLLHLAALCTALYYAPQIQAYIQERRQSQTHNQAEHQTEQHIPQLEPEAPELRQQQAVPTPRPFIEDAEEDDQEQPDAPFNDFAGPAGAQQDDDDGEPGPVNPRPQAPPGSNNNRTVGAKKAKSLQRRDQRRAYHEFMRSQGEAQRARDAEGAEEREAQLAAERARRAVKEAEVEAKRAKEREEKKLKEERAREEEIQRRERAVRLVRAELESRRVVDLEDVARQVGGNAGREWIEGLVRASGLLLESQGQYRTMITANGWAVRVESADMEALYSEAVADADGDGAVAYAKLGERLESILREGIAAS